MDNSKEIEGIKKVLDMWIDKKNMLLLSFGKTTDTTQIFKLTHDLKEAEENIEKYRTEHQRLEKTTSITPSQSTDIFSLLQNTQPQTAEEKKQHQIQFEEFLSKTYEDFYKKIGTEESLFNLFETIISDAELNQVQKYRLTELVKNDTHFSLKSILVASLMLRGSKPKLDEFVIELLIDFVLQGEENVWQRALVGMIFSLYNKDKRISQKLKQRLNELKQIDRIQDGIYYFNKFYRQIDFPKRKQAIEIYNKLKEEGIPSEIARDFLAEEFDFSVNEVLPVHFIDMREYELFDKPYYWFMPFYAEHNKELKKLLDSCTHNVEVNLLADLMQQSIIIPNIDKYSICAHLNQLSEFQVNGLVETFDNEKTGLFEMAQSDENEKNEIEHNRTLKLFLEDIFAFQNFYPKEKLATLIEETNLLQQTSLLDLITTLEKNNAIKAEHYFNLALASDSPQEKIIYYNKAIEIKQDDHEAWNNLGNTYFNLQNYSEAITCYKKAIEIKEDDHQAWNNLGLTYANLQNYSEAINCYKKAIEIKEDKHEAWNNLGNTYDDLQNYSEAITCYKKAIEIKEDYHGAWYNLGITYNTLQNYSEAEKCFNKALEIEPNYESAYYNLACMYSLQNEKQKSLSHLEKAIELNPTKYKPMAKQDEDFKNLWEDKDFLALVCE